MSNFSYYETEQDTAYDNLIERCGPTNYPSHFHKKTEITYMEKGSCISTVNLEKYFAQTDDILFISAYYPHSYETTSDAQRFVLCPNDSIINDFSSLNGKKIFKCLLDNKSFNKEKVLPIMQVLCEVHKDNHLPQNVKWLESKGYLNILYGRLLECYHDCLIEKNNQIETLANILTFIDEHSSEKLTLDSLAAQFGYNKYHFSKLFNSSVGQNLNNYINGVRINDFVKKYNAKRNLNIMSLAFEVGFDSMPSFYRAFKAFYGCTPSQYFPFLNE